MTQDALATIPEPAGSPLRRLRLALEQVVDWLQEDEQALRSAAIQADFCGGSVARFCGESVARESGQPSGAASFERFGQGEGVGVVFSS